ncbi:MAG: hypothetical protein AMXMBFR47_23760 [Planctomycetota bacterium]
MRYQEVLERSGPPQTFREAVEYAAACLHQLNPDWCMRPGGRNAPPFHAQTMNLLNAWLMFQAPEPDPVGRICVRGEGWSL